VTSTRYAVERQSSRCRSRPEGHDDGTLTSTLVTDVVAGKTIVKTPIDVTRKK
jgi:hypothetical protein